MPFHSSDGSDDLVFMNRADQELYLVPAHLEPLFQTHNNSNSKSSNPIVIAKYYLPGTNLKWYATQYEEGFFYGFVTGNIYPEWRLFTIEQWNEMARIYGHNILRDEEFQPKLLSQAVPESEMHGQGSGAVIENIQDATAELLAEYEQSYLAEDKAEYGSRSPETLLAQQLEQAKRDLHQEYGRNPALVKRLSELWGAETNDCGVAIKNVEKTVLIENPSLHAEINLYETKKGYWLYGISVWMQYGSGSSYAPSVFQKEILTSKEDTIQVAKAEITKRLRSELSSISKGEKLQHHNRLKQAIEALTAPPAQEQIELF